MDSGVRDTQHVSKRGTPWGVKPVDHVEACHSRQVQVADTPDSKWQGGGQEMCLLCLEQGKAAKPYLSLPHI
jgi:hypothetical protein